MGKSVAEFLFLSVCCLQAMKAPRLFAQREITPRLMSTNLMKKRAPT